MGRRVVITGGGAGLGRAIAKRFAADGDTVILLGRTPAKVEATAAELGPPADAVVCDVGDAASVRRAFAHIAERHGGLDILINNAAVYEPFLVKDATDAQIAAAVQTNLAGPIYCAREAIPLLQRGAQIINIGSETVTVPHAMFSLYQSTKAGLERFTEALRAELDGQGVRVVLVRAGQMEGEDSRAPTNDMNVLRQFAEENMKRGLNLRERPRSTFASVAELVRMLTHLPADVNTPVVVVEARQP